MTRARTTFVLVLAMSLTTAAFAQQPRTQFDPKRIKPLLELLRRPRDLREIPPVAQRLAVRLLEKENGEGNAVVFVEFAPGVPAPAVLTIELERGKATLRDDGKAPDERAQDGIHSGFVRVDVKQLEEANRRLLRAERPIPIFVGRQLVATFTPERVEGEKLRSLRDIPPFPSRANFADVQATSREIRKLTFPVAVTFKPGILIPLFPLVDPNDVDAQAFS